MRQERPQVRGKKAAKPVKPLKRAMTISGRDWSWEIRGGLLKVRDDKGQTTTVKREEFHQFATITPGDVKRFIKNDLKPVAYADDSERARWQAAHGEMFEEGDDEEEEICSVTDKPLRNSVELNGETWTYVVDAVNVLVRKYDGTTWTFGKDEFHRFSTVTPGDIKRFILNDCEPVDYPFGGERERWQKVHDGVDLETERERMKKYTAGLPEEWKKKVESGEIFVDDEGVPVDPADDFYPEHAKVERAQGDSQVIGEFLDWLTNERPKGVIFLCERHPTHQVGDLWVPFNKGIEKLLAEYFGIDEAKLEKEKREILARQRKANKS